MPQMGLKLERREPVASAEKSDTIYFPYDDEGFSEAPAADSPETPEERYQHVPTPETTPRCYDHEYVNPRTVIAFLQIKARDNKNWILLEGPLEEYRSWSVKDLKDKLRKRKEAVSAVAHAGEEDDHQLQMEGSSIPLGDRKLVRDLVTGGHLILESFYAERCEWCNRTACHHALGPNGCNLPKCKGCHFEFNSRTGLFCCDRQPLPKEPSRHWKRQSKAWSSATSNVLSGTCGNHVQAPSSTCNIATGAAHGDFVHALNSTRSSVASDASGYSFRPWSTADFGAVSGTHDGYVQVPVVVMLCTPCL